MNLGVYIKQPSDVTDYDVDYSEWLVDADAVHSATATASPDTITVESVFYSSSVVKVWLSGGANNQLYKITVRATTDDGRVREDEFRVKVKDL